jgi:RimJ/RimL family protein N-acetyltransferase
MPPCSGCESRSSVLHVESDFLTLRLNVLESICYSDGVVTIRPLSVNDIEADLAAKDDEQIYWLWEPGQRVEWESMSLGEQRTHALRILLHAQESFGPGPKWSFAVDIHDVAYVDCGLANNHIPTGQANIAFAANPAFRGRGYVSRAVRLVLRFLKDHTNASEAHIVVDTENVASLRVARTVGASAVEEWVNNQDRTMVRHVVQLSDEHP